MNCSWGTYKGLCIPNFIDLAQKKVWFSYFFLCKTVSGWILEKKFLFRRISIQEQEDKIRISKNIRSIVWQFICVWCFSFFHLFIFYAKLKFCATLVMVIFKQGNQALNGALYQGGLIGPIKCSTIMATGLDIRKCHSFTPCK